MRIVSFECAYCSVPAEVITDSGDGRSTEVRHTPLSPRELERVALCGQAGGPWVPLNAMQALPTQHLLDFGVSTYLHERGPAWTLNSGGGPHPFCPLDQAAGVD